MMTKIPVGGYSLARHFDAFESGMTKQEACQEAGRCLRCDRYGYGSLKGGRAAIW